MLRFGRLPARAALQDEPGGVLPEGEEPLPQLFFSLESSPPSAPRLDGLRVSTVELEMEARAWDLELVVVDDGPNPHLALGYDVRSLDRIPASRILRHVQNVLRRAVDDPDRSLSRLSVLDEGERQRQLWFSRRGQEQLSRPEGTAHLRTRQSGASVVVGERRPVRSGDGGNVRPPEGTKSAHARSGRGVGPSPRIGGGPRSEPGASHMPVPHAPSPGRAACSGPSPVAPSRGVAGWHQRGGGGGGVDPRNVPISREKVSGNPGSSPLAHNLHLVPKERGTASRGPESRGSQ